MKESDPSTRHSILLLWLFVLRSWIRNRGNGPSIYNFIWKWSFDLVKDRFELYSIQWQWVPTFCISVFKEKCLSTWEKWSFDLIYWFENGPSTWQNLLLRRTLSSHICRGVSVDVIVLRFSIFNTWICVLISSLIFPVEIMHQRKRPMNRCAQQEITWMQGRKSIPMIFGK